MPSYHIGNKELTIKINTMNFYVGQEVVCINPKGTANLIKNKKYIVTGLRKCKCGSFELSVGIIDYCNNICYKCGVSRIVCNGEVFYMADRFATLEFIPTSHEIAVKKLIEESQTILN